MTKTNRQVSRRQFVTNLVSGAVGTAALSTPSRAAGGADRPGPAQVVDVLVCGGGTAGAIAAIQAARVGASTMLVEMGGQLGGTTTTGGVDYPGLFHAWGRQIIAGIGWELVLRSVQLDGGALPDFTQVPTQHYHHQVRVNGPLYAALLEEAFVEAGGRLHYYELASAIQPVETGYELELVGKESTRRIACRQLIDTTGDANLVGRLSLPRLREAAVQPGTMIFDLGNVDVAALDADVIERQYRAAVSRGELLPGDVANPHARFIDFLRAGGRNAQHVLDADGSTSAGKTRANIAGRQSVLRILRFVRTLPGCENVRLVRMQTEAGIRETYRIAGEAIITEADYVSGRVFDDAVCYSFYPIDLHDERGVAPQPLSPGTVPTVPVSALIPQGSRNLMVAGRCVSSDRAANSALRVQACCMAMGQAAGAAAALAAAAGTTPAQVSLRELRELLVKHGAIVPRA